MAGPIPKIVHVSKFPRAFFGLYLLVGLIFNFFPILLGLLPIMFFLPFQKQKSVRLTTLQLKKLKRRMLALHFIWMVAMVFMPVPAFMIALGVGWHACSGAFFLFYLNSIYTEAHSHRISRLLILTVACFAVLWGIILADVLIFENQIRLSLVEGVTVQAQGLRKVLLENKLSPYQLPASVRMLLEKGAKEWSEMMVNQLPTGIFGFLMIAFFLYWILFDMRFMSQSLRIHRVFEVPDWSMWLVVFWLTVTLLGYILANLITQYEFQLPLGLADFCKLGGLFGFGATLWWYAFEGASIITRRQFAVRKFWIFFLLIGIVLFNLPLAVMILMALGVLAQVRRFMPKKTDAKG